MFGSVNLPITDFPGQKIILVNDLKVPKREIFDRSDFDFYTVKSLRVGDLGVKIKKSLKNI